MSKSKIEHLHTSELPRLRYARTKQVDTFVSEQETFEATGWTKEEVRDNMRWLIDESHRGK